MTELILAVCPFCKKPPGTKVGPPALARCINPDCKGKQLAAETLDDWNAAAARANEDGRA